MGVQAAAVAVCAVAVWAASCSGEGPHAANSMIRQIDTSATFIGFLLWCVSLSNDTTTARAIYNYHSKLTIVQNNCTPALLQYDR